MPVALVNSDRGTVVSGEHVNAGAEIAKSLTADDSLDWHVVDAEQARSGVEHGKYYFMLELPADFSAAIASPLTGQPKKADMIVVYNDANNYISSSIGQTAISEVLNAVSTRISGQAVNQVLSEVISSGARYQTGCRRRPSAGRRRGEAQHGHRQADRRQAAGTQLDAARRFGAVAASQPAPNGIDGPPTPAHGGRAKTRIGGNTEHRQQGARFRSAPPTKTPRPTSVLEWPRSSSRWRCSSVRWCCGWCCGRRRAGAIAAEVLAIRVVLASYLPAAVIGIFQAVILYCVVRFALGMHVAHPAAMLAFMVLISSAFVAATQAINALVGPAVGRVLIMALLMVQLVSAGGMYPVETTSQPFQTLHRFDPMTYGVNGLRQLILGGIDGRLWQAIIVTGWHMGSGAGDLVPIRPTRPTLEPRKTDPRDQGVIEFRARLRSAAARVRASRDRTARLNSSTVSLGWPRSRGPRPG